jgi:Sulfotransferase domain
VTASVDTKASPTEGSRSRLPDFFIVGHPKCGTTALFQMLRLHPQIHAPVKEPRFFAPELRSRFLSLGPGTAPLTLEGYRRLFAAATPDQRIGEATAHYLRSEDAARRIAEVQPDARIIIVLREPASFLRSFHLQAVHNHVETVRDFEQAISLEAPRREGRRLPRFSQSPSALLYSDHVRYVDQLRRFYDAFPSEQILVLIYDDFRRDNEATVRRVMRFLDVDDTVPIEAIQTRRLPAVRSLSLYRLSIAVTIARTKLFARSRSPVRGQRAPARPLKRAIKGAWHRAVFGEAEPPDEDFMRQLRRRFKPEVVALSEYLGRDLVSEWGYDELD